MSSQCYACTDLGSTAPLHQFFCHPESTGIYMHTNCFVNFTVWHENINAVKMKALEYVLTWQREAREKWKDARKVEMCTRSHVCRRPFTLWAQEIRTSSSASSEAPALIDSSSDSDHIWSFPMTDSSSESD
jgi:hypothetical protein